jgi:hypothetical protein
MASDRPGSAWWLLGVLATSTGCTTAAPETAPATPAVVQEPAPTDPLERAIHERAAAGTMRPHGGYVHGSLEPGARRDHLLVLEQGRCYRVVAAGGPGVADLDLVLYDDGGSQLRQDRSSDPYPMLGDGAEICPERGSAFRLQVRAYDGAGAYAYRLYRSGD